MNIIIIYGLALFCMGIASLSLPSACLGGTLTVAVEGVSSRNSGDRQNDYKEAVLDAKRNALEQAGVEIKSRTTVKNYEVYEDYIESQCEGVLLPGFHITKIGYAEDGLYHIFLTGKIKTTAEQSFGYILLPVGFIYDDRPNGREYDEDKWKIDDMPLSNYDKVLEYTERNKKGNWQDVYWKIKVPAGMRKMTCFGKYAYFNINSGKTLRLRVFDFQNWSD